MIEGSLLWYEVQSEERTNRSELTLYANFIFTNIHQTRRIYLLYTPNIPVVIKCRGYVHSFTRCFLHMCWSCVDTCCFRLQRGDGALWRKGGEAACQSKSTAKNHTRQNTGHYFENECMIRIIRIMNEYIHTFYNVFKYCTLR